MPQDEGAAGEPSGHGGDVAAALELVETIVRCCPERTACSAAERRAQALVAGRFVGLGLPVEYQRFSTSRDLFAVLALHFGLGTIGALVAGRAPSLALALHGLAGASYLADSTHRATLLRRLLPAGRSQNLLAIRGAGGAVRLRVVVAAHVDAAFTGVMFWPSVVRWLHRLPSPRGPAWLERPLAVATYGQLLLAGLSALEVATGRRWPGGRWLRVVATLPAAATALLAADVVRRGEVVPGANDNLTGVAASVVLAERLRHRLPAGVEIVFAITGAEEAGLGGARALAASGRWDPACTVVLGLDTLCGGELRYFAEGEIEAEPVPPWLERLIRRCAAAEPRFAGVRRFAVPVGQTDVYAFRRRGFDGVCLGTVDPELGAPRHYHLPSDRPEQLSAEELARAIDFAEALVRAIVDHRLVGQPVAAGTGREAPWGA